jgi:hypothetical protein
MVSAVPPNGDQMRSWLLRFGLTPRIRTAVLASSCLGLLIGVGLLQGGLIEGVTRYSPLWWLGIFLLVVNIPGYVAAFGFACAVLTALFYGLVWLVRYLEHHPVAEVVIPWYIPLVVLSAEIIVLLTLAAGLLWLHYRGWPRWK